MTAYDFAGAVAGLAGAGLLLLSVLVAVLAGLRLAVVRRRPGKGRIARAVLAFAVVVGASGLVLFAAAEVTPARRALDQRAGTLAALSVLLGLVAAWRAGRRRAAGPAQEAAPAESPPPEAPASPPPRR